MALQPNKKSRRVIFIGCWVKDLAIQSLSSVDTGWEVVQVDTERSDYTGNPFIKKICSALSYSKIIRKLPRADALCIVFIDYRSKNWIKIAHLLGKPVVLYWLGSDVDNLSKGELSSNGLKTADSQWSYSEGNINELKAFGIDAQLMVTPTKLPLRLAKMPQRHEILLSIPDDRMEFYGYRDLMRLVDDFPDVRFHVVRSNRPDFYEKPNIDFEGMLNRDEMDALYDRISITVRWPEHDGTSLILMESALKGKYIISRNPFPVGTITKTYEGLCDALRKMLEMPLQPCMENREYALSHFTQEEAGKRMASYLDGVVE